MNGTGISVTVPCLERLRAGDSWVDHAGIGAPPRHFFLGRRRIEAIVVLDRWLASDHSYFKVRGDDDATYILRHDLPTGHWELTLYDGVELQCGRGPTEV